MNRRTDDRSSVFSRMFAHLFVSTTLPHPTRSHPLLVPLRDGTDPQLGGHRAERGDGS